jgi:hypothetical protein
MAKSYAAQVENCPTCGQQSVPSREDNIATLAYQKVLQCSDSRCHRIRKLPNGIEVLQQNQALQSFANPVTVNCHELPVRG